MTDWEFSQINKVGVPIAMVYVGIDDEGMSAFAEDGYYNGRLDREQSLAMARAIIEKFDPPLPSLLEQVLGPLDDEDELELPDVELPAEMFASISSTDDDTDDDPPVDTVGQHARVVDGPMCGEHGFVVGHVRETGNVILDRHEGLLIQPSRFVRIGP